MLDGVHHRLYQDALDANLVPSIPVQPISYGDAEEFLSCISGEEAPKDWQGQINITYCIGPEFANGYVTAFGIVAIPNLVCTVFFVLFTCSSELVYLEVNNEFVNKTTYNKCD